MRVLALADKPPPMDPALMATQMRVDAVLCLGDLDRAWIDTLAGLSLPKLGVRGNHDVEPYMEPFGIDDVHLRRIELDGGPTVCGFEGCVDYRHGAGEYGPMYSQRKAAKLMRKLPPADVVLCHCPPYGVNDDPDDPAHVGFDGLLDWVDRHKPRHILHGHTHPVGGVVQRRYGDTRVHWISGARVLSLD